MPGQPLEGRRALARIVARRLAVIALAAGAIGPAAAAEASYPSRPIRLVVPFAAGGSVDALARLISDGLAERTGVPVVIDNRGGANGNIGAEAVARAAPDGYTLLMGNVGTHGINPSLYRRLPYDPVKDFTPVSMAATVTLVFAAYPGRPVTTVGELIAAARAQPGRLSFASAASSAHLTGELFKAMAGVDLLHVPYKNGGTALADAVGGRVDMYIASIFSVQPQVQAGRLRALAVTSSRRHAFLPEVPTVAEAGVAGFESTGWNGVLAPARTPPAAVTRLNAEINAILGTPEARQRAFAQGGMELLPGMPHAFADFIAQELGKWARASRSAGIVPE